MGRFADMVAERDQMTTAQQFDKALNKVGPYTAGFSMPYEGMGVAQQTRPKYEGMNVLDKVGAWTGQSAKLGASAVRGAFGLAKSALEGPKSFINDIYESTYAMNRDLDRINFNISKAQQQQEALSRQYSTGKISRDDYLKALHEVNKSAEISNRELADIMERTKNPGEVLQEAAETAGLLLSFGSYAPAMAAYKAGKAGAFGIKQLGINNYPMLALQAEKAEEAASKIWSVRALLERNAKNLKTTGITPQQILRQSAVALMIKNPLVYHYTIGDISKLSKQLSEGDAKGAVGTSMWLTTLAFSGGLFGWAKKGSELPQKVKNSFEAKAYGRASVMDELGRSLKDADPRVWAKHIDTLPDEPEAIAKLDAANVSYTKTKLGQKVVHDVPSPDGETTRTTLGEVKKHKEGGWRIAGDRKGRYKTRKEATIALIKRQQAKLEAETGMTKQKQMKFIRQFQESLLRQFNGNAVAAVKAMEADMVQRYGVPLKDMTYEEFITRNNKYMELQEKLHKAIRSKAVKGLEPEDADKIALGVFDISSKKYLVSRLQEMTPLEAAAHLENLPLSADAPYWSHNKALINKLKKILIDTAGDVKKMASEIESMTTAGALKGLPSDLKREFEDAGYVAIKPKINRSKYVPIEETRPLVTDVWEQSDDVLPTIAPNRVLAGAVGILEEFGLGIKAQNDIANHHLSANAAQNFMENGLAKKLGFKPNAYNNEGERMLHALELWVTNRKPPHLTKLYGTQQTSLTDLRFLKVHEIQEALSQKGLKISSKDARVIRASIRQAYEQVPLSLRGLGERASDWAFKLPGYSQYRRYQGAFRYTYNPFFRLQEVAETKILSKMEAGKFHWAYTKSEREQVAKVLDKTGMFTSTNFGVGAEDQVLGKISANITMTQKRDLAGLAAVIAERQGVDISNISQLEKFIRENPEQLEDALRVIVQYPRKGIISSPLARTLNIAFFPARYNIKVATLTAKAIAEMPPTLQKATIQSIFQFNNWLQTDEGIRWQQEYDDILDLMKWITPYNSVEYVMNLLTGNTAESVEDNPAKLGLIGGLPFGVITQMLDGQGIIDLNTPFMDMKTGTIFPTSTPQSDKARLARAITDFFNSTFTFPGRVMGLPGKNATMRDLVDAFIDTNQSDYKSEVEYDKLTPLQKKQYEVLNGMREDSDELLDVYLYKNANFRGYQLPPTNALGLPYVPPKPSKSRARRPKIVARPPVL